METWVPAPVLAPRYCDSECKLPVPPPFQGWYEGLLCVNIPWGYLLGVLWVGQGRAEMFFLSLPLSTSYVTPRVLPDSWA